jgi:hypothetical protein
MRALIFSLLLIGSSASASENAGKLDQLVKRYLDGLFRAKPHLATFMGDHRFDGELPKLGAAAEQKREAELVAQQKELQAIAAAGDLGDDGRADAQIMADGIALELLYLREIRDWEWDPRLYDSFPYYDPREIVGGRLSDIIHGDFAPEAARKKSVLAELAALPQFLADEEQALAHPRGKRHTPKVYAEQGIKANQGTIEFFKNE